jgi:starch phosphorylase
MKAALNGVPSLSVLDGWWIEGHIEGVTGWSIGVENDAAGDPAPESRLLYDKPVSQECLRSSGLIRCSPC